MSKIKYFVYHHNLNILDDSYEYIEYSKLKKIKKADEIFVFDMLDFLDHEQQKESLKLIASKLKNLGTIKVQGVDALLLSSALLNKQIDLQLYNNILLNGKKYIHTMGQIRQLVQDAGYVILETKFLNGIQYYLNCGYSGDQ